MENRYLLIVACCVVIWFLILQSKTMRSKLGLSFSNKDSIILIPGLGGSILEGVWSRDPQRDSFYCKHVQREWTQLWPTAYSVIPIVNNCWAERFDVNIYNDGKRYSSADGVTIRAKDFGGLSGIDILESFNFGLLNLPIVKYFEETVSTLELFGYSDIHGAPYDFRLILDPEYLSSYCSRLKKLIESAATSNSSKVSIISHSLGCPVTSYFLGKQRQGWKDTYINNFVSIAGPYGGSTKALEACLTGTTEGLPVEDAFLRTLEKKMAGVIWMINEPSCWKDTPIVNNVTANNLSYVLDSAGETATSQALNHTEGAWKITLRNPGVKTHLVYGTGISTVQTLKYDYDFDYPIGNYTYEGDGTVPLRSLKCAKDVHNWNIKTELEIDGADHLGILSNPVWLNNIGNILG